MGEYKNGRWAPTFGDEAAGLVDSPTSLYNKITILEERLRAAQRLAEANALEIGSYEAGTGLRGEWKSVQPLIAAVKKCCDENSGSFAFECNVGWNLLVQALEDYEKYDK